MHALLSATESMGDIIDSCMTLAHIDGDVDTLAMKEEILAMCERTGAKSGRGQGSAYFLLDEDIHDNAVTSAFSRAREDIDTSVNAFLEIATSKEPCSEAAATCLGHFLASIAYEWPKVTTKH